MTTVDLDKLAEQINTIPEEKLHRKDVTPHHIPQPQSVPPVAVQKFMTNFKREQESAAKHCIETAEWLERMADDLKRRAAILNHQATQIPDDILHAVEEEQNTTDLLNFLSSLRKE